MGMRPEEMERWGAASIFKESGRLLHKHYRLYLPFFLAFYLPGSIAAVFQVVFNSPPSTALLYAIVGKGSVNTTQTTDPPSDPSFPTIFSWTIHFLIYVLGTLGAGAVFYITNYLYTSSDNDDTRSIVPEVFKLLPLAFPRLFLTRLWIFLAILFVYFISFIIAVFLQVIISAATGWSDLVYFTVIFALSLSLAGVIYLSIVFALAEVIAVLEPGNYGRKALKRSTKLARIGRVWTIVAVALPVILLSLVLSVPTYAIMSGGMPVWAKVVLGVVVGGVDSVFAVYFGVVSALMYFVYKARFDASGSAGIPVFKRIDSAGHSYDPIVQGKDSDTFIGEP